MKEACSCLIRILLAGCLFLAGSPSGLAIFAIGDLQKIPIDRLTANLEAQCKKNPKDHQSLYALARVHSMAYADMGRTFHVRFDGSPFFGYSPGEHYKRLTVRKAPDAASRERAQRHLKRATATYQKLVDQAPDHAKAHLGLGWCLLEAGEKDKARKILRKTIQVAYPQEKKQGAFEASAPPITQEACAYLRPLLDPKKDARELATMKQYQEELAKMPRWVTPILLPLEDGLAWEQLVQPDAGVPFDLDGSGRVQPWPWISPRAAWLVHDHQGQGNITSGLQLFGSVTFWIFWENGYQALASLDNNGDGELHGEELTGLALWQDRNSNGKSEPGEVRPLSAWNIEALSCHHQDHSLGFPYNPRGVRFKDGSIRATYDWIVN